MKQVNDLEVGVATHRAKRGGNVIRTSNDTWETQRNMRKAKQMILSNTLRLVLCVTPFKENIMVNRPEINFFRQTTGLM